MKNSITFKEYIEKINIKDSTVITIGNFDGLHRGHMELIHKTIELAEAEDLLSVVFSYEVHPQNVLYRKLVHLIMPAEEKERILQEKGIFMVLQVPFDESLQNQTAFQFCDEVLIKRLKAKYLVMGEDAFLPTFFLYCLSKQKGSVAPKEVTSIEKSTSSRFKLCSIARLTAMQSSIPTPWSPSITTRMALSFDMVKSIKNKLSFSFNTLSIKLLTLSLKFIIL